MFCIPHVTNANSPLPDQTWGLSGPLAPSLAPSTYHAQHTVERVSVRIHDPNTIPELFRTPIHFHFLFDLLFSSDSNLFCPSPISCFPWTPILFLSHLDILSPIPFTSHSLGTPCFYLMVSDSDSEFSTTLLIHTSCLHPYSQFPTL